MSQRLLFFAEAAGRRIPRELREMLIWLRACGVEVSRVPGTARFKLTQGRALTDAEWAEVRDSYLVPHRDSIIELLGWLEHGGIPVRSKVLDGEIVWLTGNVEWMPDEARRRAAYTPEEIEVLVGTGGAEAAMPDVVKQLHAVKLEFGGVVQKADTTGDVTVNAELKQVAMF